MSFCVEKIIPYRCEHFNILLAVQLHCLFGVLPRPLPAFLAVWCGQTEREASFLNLKLHAARFGVCVGLLALAGVSCGIGGQPVLEVGVVGTDMDNRALSS